MGRMIERAQVDKFLKIISSNLGISKYSCKNEFVNVHTKMSSDIVGKVSKCNKDYKKSDFCLMYNNKQMIFSNGYINLYNKNLFKSENGKFLNCDYCGLLFKTGEFTFSNIAMGLQFHSYHTHKEISSILSKIDK